MSTERNTSSVLAKLMGVDRHLPPSKTDGKRRVFSENYLQNVASIIHMEKPRLDAKINVFSMDDNNHVECDDIVEFSETECVDAHQVLLCGSVNSGLMTYRGNLRMKNKWNEVTCLPKTPIYGERRPTRSYLASGQSAIQSSSRGSRSERHKSIEARLQQPRSCNKIDTTPKPYSQSYLESDKLETGIFCGSSNKKQYTDFGVRNNRLGSQKRRMNRLDHNGMDTKVCENMSAKEIAKQVINQVNHSVWHSSLIGSRSCTSFSASSKRLNSRNVQKSKKTRLETWRVIKFPQERISCYGRKSPNKFDVFGTSRSNYTLNIQNGNCSIVNANFNHSRVTNARYLSNPTFFPSAWVPRSKKRYFTLDQNWCSRSEDKNSNDLFNESLDNVGDANLNSPCDPSLEEKFLIHNTKPSRDVDNHFSQDISVVAIRSSSISAPPRVKIEEGTLDEKMGVSVKLSKNILVDDASSCSPKKLVLKHELKSTTSPPRSPVSSLEGPEACRTCLNVSFMAKEMSIPQCLHDDLLGFQRKLNLIEAISTESSFEGPGMVVSSDASDGGGSTSYREDSQIPELTSESCDFSYLADVLVESGFMTENLEAGKGKWHSGNSVLDPSTFDFLEKKYGRSTHRERSERRLLFDRINSGLEETLWPFVGIYTWRKPLVKRLSVRRSYEFIEEELWASLVNQEDHEDSSDEVCVREMEWLDLEDLDFSEEIQSLLINELVEEFVIEAAVW